VLPAETPRDARPRTQGLTHVLDRLSPISEEGLAHLAPYVDIVKIGWGLPLLLQRGTLERRIGTFHRLGWRVSTGGTLLELALSRGESDRTIREAKAVGFDIIEVSEGVIDLSLSQVEEAVATVRRHELEVLVEVGKKNPHNQYSLRETLERVAHARKLGPRKVILESRESGRGVGIYDPDGGIKWDWVHALVASHPADELLFEAPMESQQIGLIVDLGGEVNLGNIAFDSVLPLASQRFGLRGDTFGISRRHREVAGSPAAKFVYYLLETHRNLEQGELVRLSRLPRRTVQSALEELKRQGRLAEAVSFSDARKREYRLT
jgi:phosphosulfolactate synthase